MIIVINIIIIMLKGCITGRLKKIYSYYNFIPSDPFSQSRSQICENHNTAYSSLYVLQLLLKLFPCV